MLPWPPCWLPTVHNPNTNHLLWAVYNSLLQKYWQGLHHEDQKLAAQDNATCEDISDQLTGYEPAQCSAWVSQTENHWEVWACMLERHRARDHYGRWCLILYPQLCSFKYNRDIRPAGKGNPLELYQWIWWPGRIILHHCPMPTPTITPLHSTDTNNLAPADQVTLKPIAAHCCYLSLSTLVHWILH